MITIVTNKNIFDSQMQTIVCPVNCVGAMGAGLALQFKQWDIRCFYAYRAFLDEGLLELGRPWLWENPEGPNVLFFPTKDHWKAESRLEWIEEGLEILALTYDILGITSICFPLLGTGCGRLKTNQVIPLMTKYLEKMQCPVSLIM